MAQSTLETQAQTLYLPVPRFHSGDKPVVRNTRTDNPHIDVSAVAPAQELSALLEQGAPEDIPYRRALSAFARDQLRIRERSGAGFAGDYANAHINTVNTDVAVDPRSGLVSITLYDAGEAASGVHIDGLRPQESPHYWGMPSGSGRGERVTLVRMGLMANAIQRDIVKYQQQAGITRPLPPDRPAMTYR